MAPLVKLYLLPDPYWRSIKKIIALEKRYNVTSTFYLLPKADFAGHEPNGNQALPLRAARYDIRKYTIFFNQIIRQGWEVGVHGIDAYRDVRTAQEELQILKDMFPAQLIWGIRMHWLYNFGSKTWDILQEAGYDYDATLGWDDRIGFPDGRHTPFKPSADHNFWVVPLNIQDGALLAHWQKHLPLQESCQEIQCLLDEIKQQKAVVTVLWHNVSFIYPRRWDKVYEWLIRQARADGAEIIAAGALVKRMRTSPDKL